MVGPFGRQGPADTLRQHCPQMTRRPGSRNVLDFGEKCIPSTSMELAKEARVSEARANARILLVVDIFTL